MKSLTTGNRTGYSDCVATGQYRLRIGELSLTNDEDRTDSALLPCIEQAGEDIHVLRQLHASATEPVSLTTRLHSTDASLKQGWRFHLSAKGISIMFEITAPVRKWSTGIRTLSAQPASATFWL